eukprot:SAG22_NODE_1486_length_4323_cov_3.859848_4_plen_136_part_01
MQGEYKKSLYCNRSVLFWTVFDSSTYSQQRAQYKAKFDSKIQQGKYPRFKYGLPKANILVCKDCVVYGWVISVFLCSKRDFSVSKSVLHDSARGVIYGCTGLSGRELEIGWQGFSIRVFNSVSDSPCRTMRARDRI